MIRRGIKRDLLSASKIFLAAFPESIEHYFDRPPSAKTVELVFRTMLKAEPEAFFVAECQEQVVGYIFAPTNLSRLWIAAVGEFFTFRWVYLLLTGHLKLSCKSLWRLLNNKLSFIFAAKDQFPVKARILSIAISPEFQGKGLGKQLLATALEYLDRKQVGAVRLEVRPVNVAAISLYQSFGFQRVGSTYDAQGEWLIMVRQ